MRAIKTIILLLCAAISITANAVPPFTTQKVENVRLFMDSGRILFKPGPSPCSEGCDCNWWDVVSSSDEAKDRALSILLTAKTTNSNITIEHGGVCENDAYPKVRILNIGDLESW